MKNASLPASWRPIDSGCDIRIGSEHDGGYVIPENVLDDARVVLSLGVNLDWSFETELLTKAPRIEIQSYDHTTRLPYILWWSLTRFVAHPFTGEPRHRSAWRKPFSFLSYRWHPRVKHTAKFVRTERRSDSIAPDKVASSLPAHTPILLKMDIEGGEYEVLNELSLGDRDIVAVAMELHHVGTDDRAWALVERLLEDYSITYLHVNNAGRLSDQNVPEYVEATFVRNDYAKGYAHSKTEPYLHPLSRPNLPGETEYPIEFTLPR